MKRTKCCRCEQEFSLLDNNRGRFAALIGALAGISASRRLRGAFIGSIVGWGLSRFFHQNKRCPFCDGELINNDASRDSRPS